MSNTEQPGPDDPSGQDQADETVGSAGMPPPPLPPRAGQPLGPVIQPRSIYLAVRLMSAGAVISLLSLIVTLATQGSLKSQIRDQLEQSNQQVTENTLTAAYTSAIVITVITALISVGLWLWMAWKNGQGRRWARIVATVLAGINLLSTIFSITSGTMTLAASRLTIVNLIVAIGIVVLLWRKGSSAYYTATTQQAS